MNNYNVKSGKDHIEKTVILLSEILTVKAAKISKKLLFPFRYALTENTSNIKHTSRNKATHEEN